MHESHSIDEKFRVRNASQEGSCERKQGIEKVLATIIFPPGHDSFGESKVDWFSNNILITVVHFVGPNDFVLIIKDKEAEGHYQSQSRKEYMHGWVNFFKSIFGIGMKEYIIVG